MTTPSFLSIIMEMKIWTLDKFKKMKQLDIEPVCPALFTTKGGCSWRE
jgi:hypothetical protein